MKILYAFSILVLVLGCNSSSPKLEASIDEVPNGSNVYLARLGPQNVPVPLDTTQVNNNSFEFDLTTSKKSRHQSYSSRRCGR